MKHIYANGRSIAQILGLIKPRIGEGTEVERDEDLYKKRLSRLRQLKEADQKGGKELSTGRPFDRACIERSRSTQGDEQNVEDSQVNGSLLSIPMQTNTSFVPYITSVSKQCLQPMAYGLRLITVLIFSLCLLNSALAQSRLPVGAVDGRVLQGEVRSADSGQPLEGVSIRVDRQRTVTDSEGKFTIRTSKQAGSIEARYIGYKTITVPFDPTSTLISIQLESTDQQIEEVEVVSTGYQRIPRERATGSFEFIDSALFNRKVSTDFLSRLEDVVPGLSSTKVFTNNRGNLPGVNIRGESTLRSEKWPLIVVDGVPYENRIADYGFGNFNNINPNDIESITVLKDAAAASIWGARAGNGVIVITTKRAGFNERVNIDFNTNLSVRNKPDLYYYPQMPTSDYIEVVRFLFGEGRYDGSLASTEFNSEPIVKWMDAERNGAMTADELNMHLEALKAVDQRDDFLKYIYRNEVTQQYSLRLGGGGPKVNSTFLAGYDKNLGEVVTSDYQRLNLKSNSQYKPIEGLVFHLGLGYAHSRKNDSQYSVAYRGLADGVSNYPYMQLADANGNPLTLDILPFKDSYIEGLADGRLLDWSYVPLQELGDSKKIQVNDELAANFNMEYTFPFGLRATTLYSYLKNNNPITELRGLGSYVTRHDINYFASWDARQVYWNMPVGDQLIEQFWNSNSHQGRISLDYNKKWNRGHELNILAGYDIRQLSKSLRVAQYYGLDSETGAFQPMPFGQEVPYFNGLYGINNLPDNSRYELFTNRFRSYYANASYVYRDRYIWSGSYRKDASNLFGVKSNEKGSPFWSLGGAWIISKEGIISNRIFSLLKVRATYGYNGNINNTVSALPIINIQSNPHGTTGEHYANIVNPPNPSLRWERVGNLNMGLDFAVSGNRLNGSLEYYWKTPKDLVAPSEIDPSLGFTTMILNTAHLDTKGVDISLNGTPIQNKGWEWRSNLVFSYNKTMVKQAFLSSPTANSNVSKPLSFQQTPIEGMNLYSLLVYRSAGLDPEDGSPRIYLDDEVSNDYIAAMGADVNTLENKGSQVPLYFGSLRNSIRYKRFEVSCNISYQLGFKFIRQTFSNAEFLTYRNGHSDYALRWQKPGDELITDVPAFAYPNNAAASTVFISSSSLVENGSQIKLRDLQCSVDVPQLTRYGFNNFRIYGYVQNIGTIWRANNRGIDPEYGHWIPDPLMSSLGINFNF